MMDKKIKKVNIYRKPGPFDSDDDSGNKSGFEKFLVNRIEYHPIWHKVILDTQFDPHGNVEQEAVYEYNDHGFLIREVLKEADGEVSEEKTFEPDEKMRIYKEYRHYVDGSYDVIEVHYDASDRVVKKILSDDEGVVESTVEYEYNNELLIRESHFDDEGDLVSEVLYAYDEDGLLDEKTTRNINEGEEVVRSYSYNDEGFRDAILTYDGKGELVERHLFTLDDQGRPVGVVEENKQKKNRLSMEYDANGNIVFQEEYDLHGNLVSMVRRHYDQEGLFQKSEVTARNPMSGVNQQYEVKHIYEFFDE